MHQGSIDVGIVNYNGGAMLKKCIESLLEQTNATVNIYVLDNCSADNSAQILESFEDKIVKIMSPDNLGYAKGCNLLFAYFKSPICAFANMDLSFDKNWADSVLKLFDNYPEIGSAGSLVLLPDNTINSAGIEFYKDFHPQNVLYGVPLTNVSLSKDPYIFGPYGAVMAFRRDALLNTGLLDEDFYMFYEETDLNWRMQLHGFKSRLCTDAKVNHIQSMTTKKYSTFKLFYGERNRVLCAFKIAPVWYWPIMFFYTFKRLLHGVKSLNKNRTVSVANDNQVNPPSKLVIVKTLLKAWGSALTMLPIMLKKRKSLPNKKVVLPILNQYGFNLEKLRV